MTDPRTGTVHEVVLRGLVADGTLSPEQGDAVIAALDAAGGERHGVRTWLAEIAGYVGGGLTLAGVALFVSVSWDSLTRPGRVGLLGGLAVLFGAGGAVVAGGPRGLRPPTPRRLVVGRSVRARVTGVLFALTALMVGAATGVGYHPYPWLAGTLAGLVVAVVGLGLLPTTPGVVATAAASVGAVAAVAVEVLDVSPLQGGLLVLALGAGWTVVAVTGLVSPRWLPFTIGAGLALVGAQQPLGTESTVAWAYGLTFAVAIGCFGLYRRYRLTVLLVAGVIGVTVAAPEAVADWTAEGALGGALILLTAGAALIVASVVGLRLRGAAAGRPEAGG